MKIKLFISRHLTPENVKMYYEMDKWLWDRKVEYQFKWHNTSCWTHNCVEIVNAEDALAFKLKFAV